MEREDILKFTNSVILLSKLFTTMEDRFLKQKLHNKISDFVSAFVEQKNIHSPASNVSHNISRDLTNSINNLIDYLEHLAHTSKTNTTPLLVAQRNLLKLKLHILQQKKRPSAEVAVPLSSFPERPVPASQQKVNIGSGTTKHRLKSNSNKERIFNYIKKTPEVRARDVMNEFSVLSDRTIKRSLKELTDEGFLKKISDGAAVYYLTAE